MIISHRHRFIFIKTLKTAGTSVEIALSKHCGDHDVVTAIAPVDEQLRCEVGGRPPQNAKIRMWRYSPKDWGRLMLRRRAAEFRNHASAAFIRQHVPKHIWTSYFKFCFERNPFDKCLSWYYWTYPCEPRPTLSEFVSSYKLAHASDYDRYSIRGKIAVDRVFRFEELRDSMDELQRILGLDSLWPLPRAKAGHRTDRIAYREILDQADRRRVEAVFSREIKELGYDW